LVLIKISCNNKVMNVSTHKLGCYTNYIKTTRWHTIVPYPSSVVKKKN